MCPAGEWGCAAIFDRIEPKPVAPDPNDNAVVVVVVVASDGVALPERRKRVVTRKGKLHEVPSAHGQVWPSADQGDYEEERSGENERPG
jgi:hypothetical protein